MLRNRTIEVFDFVQPFALVMAIVCVSAVSAVASEEVGKAVAIVPAVKGAGGALDVGSPIHRDERIVSSKSGLGQFKFRDGTKLAVGPNSSVVIDSFVFDDSNSIKKLTLNATKGTFRWISGSSKSSAYKITTPLGTLGVRGTAFDVYVGSKIAAVLLLRGELRFCGNNGGCKNLTRRCGILIANSTGVMGNGRESQSKNAVPGVPNELSFPFSTGSKTLTKPFRVGGHKCFGVIEFNERQPDESQDSSGPGGGSGSGENPNGPN